MKRQTVLLAVLGALVLLGLPYHFLDSMLSDRRQALAQVEEELITLRKQARALEEREQALEGRRWELADLEARLLGDQPLNRIDQILREAAGRSGLALERVTILGPDPVADMAGLERYEAAVSAAGTRTQFVEFLRALEEHAVLIELPEVALTLPPDAAAPIQPELELGFYTRAPLEDGD